MATTTVAVNPNSGRRNVTAEFIFCPGLRDDDTIEYGVKSHDGSDYTRFLPRSLSSACRRDTLTTPVEITKISDGSADGDWPLEIGVGEDLVADDDTWEPGTWSGVDATFTIDFSGDTLVIEWSALAANIQAVPGTCSFPSPVELGESITPAVDIRNENTVDVTFDLLWEAIEFTEETVSPTDIEEKVELDRARGLSASANTQARYNPPVQIPSDLSRFDWDLVQARVVNVSEFTATSPITRAYRALNPFAG